MPVLFLCDPPIAVFISSAKSANRNRGRHILDSDWLEPIGSRFLIRRKFFFWRFKQKKFFFRSPSNCGKTTFIATFCVWCLTRSTSTSTSNKNNNSRNEKRKKSFRFESRNNRSKSRLKSWNRRLAIKNRDKRSLWLSESRKRTIRCDLDDRTIARLMIPYAISVRFLFVFFLMRRCSFACLLVVIGFLFRVHARNCLW